MAQSIDNVFVFEDAKPFLKDLLQGGVVIRRLICLKTLRQLNLQPPLVSSAEPSTQEEALLFFQEMKEQLKAALETIEKLNLQKVARLECSLLPAIASMEYHGLYIEPKQFEEFLAHFQNEMSLSQKEVLDYLKPYTQLNLFGQSELNLESGLELKEALEKLLNQPLPNTSHETLSKIPHEIVPLLIRYREYAKLVRTYGTSFAEHIQPSTHRLHATFEPLGTGTGRIACHSPNLQNLPSEPLFRKAICAPPGKMLVTADYSACELRIVAGLSRDAIFLEAFEKNTDVHSEVASQLFKVPVSKDKNPQLRQKAKAINFGLIYGMGSASLAATLKLSQPEAEALLERYFKTYPKVKAYLDDLVFLALQNGYSKTVFGRKLFYDPEILKKSNAKQEIARIAKNMPIQGTAADMLKWAMIGIHEKLITQFPDAFLVNTIHDELVVECPREAVEGVCELVKNEMEKAQALMVPLVRPCAEVAASHLWRH